jgi:predicted lipoprotein with Yx(FWY)xxD motif
MKIVVTALALAVLCVAAPATLGARPTAAPPSVKVRASAFGTILFAGNGRALYAFTRDRRGGPSRCYGDCAAAWPVYYAKGVLTSGRGARKELLGTVRRRDGRRQVTYNGWPLYYYAHERAGEVKCQNVQTHGGTWLVVRPNGTLVR